MVEKKNILFVDDSEAMKMLLLAGFKEHSDVEIHWVTDPRLALEVARRLRPVICLIDLQMPHLSGQQVFKILRGNEDLKTCKIGFITGTDDEANLKDLSQLSPDAIFKKPFNIRQIVKDIKALL